MKYDFDNNDIAVAALLVIAVFAMYLLSGEAAATIVGAIIGFIGRGVAAKTPNGNGNHGGAASGTGKDLTKQVP